MENDPDDFHDSDSGVDVFALFNACDGKMWNGFLDVRELDKYSPKDAEALNVARLRVVWEHTTTGCIQCREIIEALQELRGAVREATEIAEPDDGPDQIKL